MGHSQDKNMWMIGKPQRDLLNFTAYAFELQIFYTRPYVYWGISGALWYL